MATELLVAKLFIPPLRPNLVPRLRLIQLLNDGLQRQHKLTLVSAPAGFGKTTIVVDWLRQVDLPAAWLSLDKADNDLPRFLAYLAGALQQVDEEIGAHLHSALQSSRLPSMEMALIGLLNEIAARPKPFILVLDDYQLLCEAAILQVMALLLDHQPPQLHLVWITVRGRVDIEWLRSLEGPVEIIVADAGQQEEDGKELTAFSVISDQAGIVGLMRTLHTLGMTIQPFQIVQSA